MSALLRLAELNAAYAAAIDNDRLEEWPDFFVDDCLYKITSAENHRRGYAAGIVYADSRAMLRDRVTALRERQHLRAAELSPHHRPAGDRCRRGGRDHGRDAVPGRPDHARREHAICSRPEFISTRLRDEGRRLRFVERIVVCDSAHFDTLLAIPL